MLGKSRKSLIRLCLLLMFNTETKPVDFETMYGEHEHSTPNVLANDTILQEELLANYGSELAQAKECYYQRILQSLGLSY